MFGGLVGLAYVSAFAATGLANPRDQLKNLFFGDEIYKNEWNEFVRNANTNQDGISSLSEIASAFKGIGLEGELNYKNFKFVMEFPRPTFRQLRMANESYRADQK